MKLLTIVLPYYLTTFIVVPFWKQYYNSLLNKNIAEQKWMDKKVVFIKRRYGQKRVDQFSFNLEWWYIVQRQNIIHYNGFISLIFQDGGCFFFKIATPQIVWFSIYTKL